MITARTKTFLLLLGIVLLNAKCRQSATTQFKSLTSEQTGVTFNNIIQDHDSLSILSYEYIYNGGGAAIGDINNDELPDIVFTGNMVPNAVYLNMGNLKFKDISHESGINKYDRWSTGVTLVDINADGWLDIYITSSGHDKIIDKSNLLFINQGSNADGIPVFSEQAEKYGISENTNSTSAVFFDYDNDLDLDLFVISNQMRKDRNPSRYRKKNTDGSSNTVDHLYENVWNADSAHPTFRNVSKEAGILIEGFSLGVNICDINKDGWKDIFITNDYLSNDVLYINNQDGTFTDQSATYFKHTSFSAMGNDVVDLDNDGDAEVVALDMLPKDNFRRKTMMPPLKYIDYINNEKYDYQYQFGRNTLQTKGRDSKVNGRELPFNDVGLMAGIAATDWSWAPLIADFDNDGLRDIIVTNGFPKDVTDRDFIDYNMDVNSFVDDAHLIDKIPSVKIKNFAFRNQGGLEFEDVTTQWGIEKPSFSNGAAYGDLDNDGDLDYVVNNINDEAFVFENLQDAEKNWIKIKLVGPHPNPDGIGATVYVFTDSLEVQVAEFNPSRGYLSTVEPTIHFGLSDHENIDSIKVYWPDDVISTAIDIESKQRITLKYQDASPESRTFKSAVPTLLQDVTDELGIDFIHKEVDYIDFNIQPMLPHKLSQYGPGLAVSDVNGDGMEDFYISGSHFEKGKFLMQNGDGTFTSADLIQPILVKDSIAEELGVLFFDADQDGDDDLYVVHGGYEYDLQDSQYLDRLYINNDGHFTVDETALPQILSSGMGVKGCDFDKDGDLDLFVAGRVNPAQYPSPVSSYILRNDSQSGKAKFTDVTEKVAPFLIDIGMVSDGLWTDFDNDGWTDLVLAGEFMPLRFVKNTGTEFIDITTSSGISKSIGWWNSIVGGDMDNDGDIDYIVGNTGRNTNTDISFDHPIKVYYNDFDKNGRYDLFPSCYFPDQQGVMREFPYFGRLEIEKQYNIIKKHFPQHSQLAVTTMENVFSDEEMEGCIILKANDFNSSYVENLGNGKFSLTAFPKLVQRSPIYGMSCQDLDMDGNLDILMVGNDYGYELSIGRMDAHDGLVALGKGNGKFEIHSAGSSGFDVSGDAKALISVYNSHQEKVIYIASQNQGPIRAFSGKSKSAVYNIKSADTHAEISFDDGQMRKEEFYFGSGFISQSGRRLLLSPTMSRVEIFSVDGESRVLEAAELLSYTQ